MQLEAWIPARKMLARNFLIPHRRMIGEGGHHHGIDFQIVNNDMVKGVHIIMQGSRAVIDSILEELKSRQPRFIESQMVGPAIAVLRKCANFQIGERFHPRLENWRYLWIALQMHAAKLPCAIVHIEINGKPIILGLLPLAGIAQMLFHISTRAFQSTLFIAPQANANRATRLNADSFQNPHCFQGDRYSRSIIRSACGRMPRVQVPVGIDEALVKHPKAKGWIVDLRGNGGGGYDQTLIERIAKLPKPVAVLIDAGCVSAGETLARDFRANAEARVFGTKSAGSSSSKRTWSFPSGIATLSLPTRSRWRGDGKPIEFNGIEPDVTVEAVPEELLEGKNSVIVRAKEYILQKADKQN